MCIRDRHAPAADEMQATRNNVAVFLQVERVELTETGETAHFPSRTQTGRGENMMTAMPSRHNPAPSRSQRVGFTASTHHNQAMATVT